MVEILVSRSGLAYAKIGATLVHSAYDPLKETKDFVNREVGNEKPSTVIIVSPGLGYLGTVLADSGIKVVSLFTEKLFAERADPRGLAWHPESGIPVESFLESSIADSDLFGIKVMEWAPDARCHPLLADTMRTAVRSFLDRKASNLATQAFFARRWMTNCLENYLLSQRYLNLRGHSVPDFPVLIAASGTSLPSVYGFLDRALVMSLPSSIHALLEAGKPPDLVVTTDPGYWAKTHLFWLSKYPEVSIAMPLSAAPLCGAVYRPFLPLDQSDSFGLLDGIDPIRLPPNGTVAASALELALRLTSGPVILAGLDFCYEDIRAHVRPHTFDFHIEPRGTRFEPSYGTWYRRAADSTIQGKFRIPRALNTYASWFKTRSWNRVYRFESSIVDIPGMKSIDETEMTRLLSHRGKFDFDLVEAAAVETRRTTVSTLIQGFLREIENPGSTVLKLLEPAKTAKAGSRESLLLADARAKARDFLLELGSRFGR